MDVTYRMLVEFLADEGIEHISEMDYILRKRYEVYMSELIKEKSVSRYLRIFDKVKQEYIRKRIETPMGRLECQWTYKNTILFIPYHSDQKIVLSVESKIAVIWYGISRYFWNGKLKMNREEIGCGVLLALPVGSHFYKQKKFAGMQRYGI